MLCHDAVEVLGPRRPAFDIPRVIVTELVAQHRGLAGRVGAGGMPWVLAAGDHMALEGGLEGGGGVVLLKSAVVFGDNVQDFGW